MNRKLLICKLIWKTVELCDFHSNSYAVLEEAKGMINTIITHCNNSNLFDRKTDILKNIILIK